MPNHFGITIVAACLAFMVLAGPGEPRAEESLTIVAVGDIMMGTDFPENLLPPEDGARIFSHVRDVLRGGDITFGNLEGPLTDEGNPVKCAGRGRNCFEFRTPRRYVRYLKDAGFDVLNIANNHAGDFGPAGTEDTIEALGGEGMFAVGGPLVASIERKGKRIAFVGFSYVSSSPYSYSIRDIPLLHLIIAVLRQQHDIVIVSFHGGAEGKDARRVVDREEVYLGEKRGNVVLFARAAVDAGADLILGHGPHVLRAMEVYRGKLIVYSLGNFLAYERFNISGPSGRSIVLRVRLHLETGDFAGGDMVPVVLANGGIPDIDPDQSGILMTRMLSEEDMGEAAPIIEDDGSIRPRTGSVDGP